jgi:DNA-binding IclR family transcriptional regulator
MPPLRRRVLVYVEANPGSTTAEVHKGMQLPRKTVDRCLQELHLLGLLVARDRQVGPEESLTTYALSKVVSAETVRSVARNVTSGTEGAPPAGPRAEDSG